MTAHFANHYAQVAARMSGGQEIGTWFMGGFAGFRCRQCGYEEARLPFGHGAARREPEYVLYRCDHCKSIGRNFAQPGRGLLCAGCYEDGLSLLEPVPGVVNCPGCDFPAPLRILDESWQQAPAQRSRDGAPFIVRQSGASRVCQRPARNCYDGRRAGNSRAPQRVW